MRRPAPLGCALLLALALAACGDDGDAATTCPNDLPASCPAAVPSYRSDIAPIIQGHCFPCHTAGGVADNAHDFSTYAHVHAQRSEMLHQVYACKMPPDGGVPLGSNERAALLAWFVCDAPDN